MGGQDSRCLFAGSITLALCTPPFGASNSKNASRSLTQLSPWWQTSTQAKVKQAHV
jgi:hypothetical protein